MIFSPVGAGLRHWWELSPPPSASSFTTKRRKVVGHIDSLLLKTPIFGSILRKVSVARFARILSTLLSSGVPILQSLEITAKTAGNVVIEDAILKVRAGVERGENFVEPLKATEVFPHMVGQMIGVGEQTGALDAMLGKIADFYEDEVDSAIADLLALIEPVVDCLLGRNYRFNRHLDVYAAILAHRKTRGRHEIKENFDSDNFRTKNLPEKKIIASFGAMIFFLSRFRNSFEFQVTPRNEFSQVIFEQKRVKNFAQNSKRRSPAKGIAHQSSIAFFDKFVLVFERFEVSLNHFIGKIVWLFKFGNFHGQTLPNAEMFPFKSYRFAEFDFAVSFSRNCFFARFICRSICKLISRTKSKQTSGGALISVSIIKIGINLKSFPPPVSNQSAIFPSRFREFVLPSRVFQKGESSANSYRIQTISNRAAPAKVARDDCCANLRQMSEARLPNDWSNRH